MTTRDEWVVDLGDGSLRERSERVVAAYDAEEKNYAFGDGGDAEKYANTMANLLEEWTARANLLAAAFDALLKPSEEPPDRVALDRSE